MKERTRSMRCCRTPRYAAKGIASLGCTHPNALYPPLTALILPFPLCSPLPHRQLLCIRMNNQQQLFHTHWMFYRHYWARNSMEKAEQSAKAALGVSEDLGDVYAVLQARRALW